MPIKKKHALELKYKRHSMRLDLQSNIEAMDKSMPSIFAIFLTFNWRDKFTPDLPSTFILN